MAALIVQGSSLRLKDVLVSALRRGGLDILEKMGASIQFENARLMASEPVVDIIAETSSLRAVEIPAEMAPGAIDEFPILAVAAAFAEGTSVFHGLGELRHKESDRLGLMVENLKACGVEAREEGDSMVILGNGGKEVTGGAHVSADGDHRIAMSFSILGQKSTQPLHIQGVDSVGTSFPNFLSSMESLGLQLEVINEGEKI